MILVEATLAIAFLPMPDLATALLSYTTVRTFNWEVESYNFFIFAAYIDTCRAWSQGDREGLPYPGRGGGHPICDGTLQLFHLLLLTLTLVELSPILCSSIGMR